MIALSLCCYYLAHWFFAFRYFEVAEMLGRKDKSNEMHIKARKITSKISMAVAAVIFSNYLYFVIDAWFMIYEPKDYNTTASKWVGAYIPNVFLGLDCLLLSIGLVWIYYSLRHDKSVMGNEKFMVLHTFLLVIVMASQICLQWATGNYTDNGGKKPKKTLD
jgi:hypothetical protein